jgi:exosortase K
MAAHDPCSQPSRSLHLRDWACVLLVVLAFKQFYATASTGQLQWLLWPLASLLNRISALSFTPTLAGEWLDTDHGLVIVKGCGGGNFLIASWLGYLWRQRDRGFGTAAVLRALAAAWLTTLAANGLRILLIAYCQDDVAQVTGLSAADSHRLIGVLVYFGVLSMQLSRRGDQRAALIVATAVYLGITLLLPAVHGILTGRGGLDATHLLWTAGLPLATLVVHQTLRRMCPPWARTHFRDSRLQRDSARAQARTVAVLGTGSGHSTFADTPCLETDVPRAMIRRRAQIGGGDEPR